MRRAVLASALALLGPAMARGQDAPPPPPTVNPAELRAPAAPGGLTDAQLAQVEAIVERAIIKTSTDRQAWAQTSQASGQAQLAAAPLPVNRVTVIVPPGPIKRAAGAVSDKLNKFASKPRTRVMTIATPAQLQLMTAASPQH